MTSPIIHQNRIERVSWDFTDIASTTYRQRITVPFLVDEIRVVALGAQATALSSNLDILGFSALVQSPDLIGSGTYLGTMRVTNADRFTTLTAANRTVSSSGCVFDLAPVRYVFPPTAKRIINGTYTFTLQTLLGETIADASVINNFRTILALEFIQYKETEKQSFEVESDLHVLGKSGRRRL